MRSLGKAQGRPATKGTGGLPKGRGSRIEWGHPAQMCGVSPGPSIHHQAGPTERTKKGSGRPLVCAAIHQNPWARPPPARPCFPVDVDMWGAAGRGSQHEVVWVTTGARGR